MNERHPPSPLPPLPGQPDDVDWPTRTWSTGPLDVGTDRGRLVDLVERAFSDPAPESMAETHALLLVQRGVIVHETYWRDYGPDDTFPSWSMAKSITHALVGILVRDGLLEVDQPAPVPEWQGAADPRREITLDQLLQMTSGLHFIEDYVDGEISNVIEMLFGNGKGDVAAYAANQPLDHAPGTVWSYSSGTSNIVARIVQDTLGLRGDAFEEYMREVLFEPLGMISARPRFDDAGTFIGSSFCFCTPRDFARFGLFYLRDGVWEGKRILPEGWVDHARTPVPVPVDDDLDYGAHWWLGLGGPGSFSCNGYQGQFIVNVPDLDLVLVRHGNSLDERCDRVREWIGEVVDCFRGPGTARSRRT